MTDCPSSPSEPVDALEHGQSLPEHTTGLEEPLTCSSVTSLLGLDHLLPLGRPLRRRGGARRRR